MWREGGDALPVGWATHIPDGHAALLGCREQFLVVRDEEMQSADNVQARFNGRRKLPAPLLGKSTANGRYTDHQRIWLVDKRFVDIAHDRDTGSEGGRLERL